MRTRSVPHAVSAVLAIAVSTAVNATSIATWPGNEQAGRNTNVYISGASSVDNTIDTLVRASWSNLCQQGTADKYEAYNVLDANGNLIGGATETLWYCQAGISSGVATTQYLAIFKESTAGSVNGVVPLIAVAKGQPSGLTFLNPAGPDVLNGTCNVQNDTVPASESCTAADFQHNVVPTGGVSDFEPSMLRTIPGGGSIAANDVHYLSGSRGMDVVWGIAVTKNLYYALQQAEHLADGTVITKCNVPNNDDPACAPSLSKQQVSALFAGTNNANGNLLTWSQILGLNNSSGDNNVYVCRQSIGAGLTAAFEEAFYASRCGASSEQRATQDGQYVIDAANTLSVGRCLAAFYKGGGITIFPFNGDYGTSYPAFSPPGGQWALGIMSTEVTASELSMSYFGVPNNADAFRFTAIDGVLPTLANVVNGYYPYFFTDSWYLVAAGQNVPTGNPLFAFKAIENDIGHPIPTQLVDASFQNRPWGFLPPATTRDTRRSR
jgi:hypothetical protein